MIKPNHYHTITVFLSATRHIFFEDHLTSSVVTPLQPFLETHKKKTDGSGIQSREATSRRTKRKADWRLSGVINHECRARIQETHVGRTIQRLWLGVSYNPFTPVSGRVLAKRTGAGEAGGRGGRVGGRGEAAQGRVTTWN